MAATVREKTNRLFVAGIACVSVGGVTQILS